MTTQGQNDHRFDDLIQQASQLGEEAALGKDSLPKLALRVLRAAADGVLDTKTLDAAGKDHATQVFETYAKTAGAKAIHDRTENGVKANVSKLRTFIRMGAIAQFDPVDVMDRAVIKRQQMLDAGVKVKPAYAAYVDVAREQVVKSPDQPLSDDYLESIIAAPGPKEMTVEKVIEECKKKLEKLITGENAHGLKDNDEETMLAFHALERRLAALLRQRKVREAREVLEAEGAIAA